MKKTVKALFKITEQYKWKSIFFKNLKKSVMIISIPVLIMVLVISCFYREMLTREAKLSTRQDFSTLEARLTNLYNETERLYLDICNNAAMSVFLSDSNSASEFKTTLNARSAILSIKRNSPLQYIDSVSVYSKKSNSSVSSGTPTHSYHSEPWLLEEDKQPFIVKSDKESGCFSICYLIENNNENNGLVIFDIGTELFSDVFLSSELHNYSYALYSYNGEALYSLNAPSKFPPVNLPENTPELSIEYENVNAAEKIGNTYLVLNKTHDTLSLSAFIWLLVLCVFVAILITLILALMITYISYQSVTNIINTLNNLENDSNIDPAQNEISRICSSIIDLHEKNISLESELLSNFTHLKQLQITTLQLQFTPHFLFNTLNTLNLVVMKMNGLSNPASKIILLLSDLLQESLQTSQYLIPISEELKNSEKYIEIEKIKTQDNFDFIVDIDENLLNKSTIKFSLQPIIENAFSHGIKYLPENTRGFIKLKIHRVEDSIVFEVSNNGPDISSEKLEEIRKNLKNNERYKHIGLSNINKRINLIFSEKYGVDITSKGGITTVTMNIPYNKEVVSPS